MKPQKKTNWRHLYESDILDFELIAMANYSSNSNIVTIVQLLLLLLDQKQ